MQTAKIVMTRNSYGFFYLPDIYGRYFSVRQRVGLQIALSHSESQGIFIYVSNGEF